MRPTICYPFVGDSVGGAHISSLELIKKIDSSRFSTLIAVSEEGILTDYLRESGMTYVVLPIPKYAGTRPSVSSILIAAIAMAPRIRKFLLHHRVNIVHCNELRSNLTWLLPSSLSRIPFIWHQRTQVSSKRIVWRSLPLAVSHIIATTQTAAEPFGGPSDKVSVIGNPFPLEQFDCDRQEARARLVEEIQCPNDDVLLGFVGRMVLSKRPDLCVEILSELGKRGVSKARLLLFGAGAPHMVEILEKKVSALGL